MHNICYMKRAFLLHDVLVYNGLTCCSVVLCHIAFYNLLTVKLVRLFHVRLGIVRCQKYNSIDAL